MARSSSLLALALITTSFLSTTSSPQITTLGQRHLEEEEETADGPLEEEEEEETADGPLKENFPASNYPPYCSTPLQMETRRVPQLPPVDNGLSVKTQLSHVTAIIRHGARTPYSARTCWDGYLEDPSTAVWDCDVTTSQGLPMGMTEDKSFRFEKVYDGLQYGSSTKNVLNGTCQLGQLLERGYEQELLNGQFLRDAYVFEDDEDIPEEDSPEFEAKLAARDERMRLFQSSEGINFDKDVYFRVDDIQRTIMSGELVLQGLFGPELAKTEDPLLIAAHTGDLAQESMYVNERTCPRLTDLRKEAEEKNPDFVAFNTSDYAVNLKGIMEDRYQRDFSNEGIDCLMTTVCEDRPMPEGLGYGGIDSLFGQIYAFSAARTGIKLTHNHAAYSKLAMGPLWKEILKNIHRKKAPKFALFSGHDDTLMPLLATLGERVWNGAFGDQVDDEMERYWTPYASMVIIEIHTPIKKGASSPYPSGKAFRIMYNGKPLQHLLPQCPDPENDDDDPPLCDMFVLTDRVEPIADLENRDCTSIPDEESASALAKMKDVVSTPGGIFLGLLLGLGFALIGSGITLVHLNKRIRRDEDKRTLEMIDDELFWKRNDQISVEDIMT